MPCGCLIVFRLMIFFVFSLLLICALPAIAGHRSHYQNNKRNPQRGIFCVRKFTRTSDKRCFFGYNRPNRSPKRGPDGVRLDSGLDHVVQNEVQMDSIWTSFLDHDRSVWTTRGPNGPCVVQTESKWTSSGLRFGPRGPKRSPNGVHLDSVLDHESQA